MSPMLRQCRCSKRATSPLLATVSPRVAIFKSRSGKHKRKDVRTKFGRFQEETNQAVKTEFSLPFVGWKGKQEKKRWVAVAPTSYPQRTATPTVRAFSELKTRFLQGGLLEVKR